LSFTRSCVQEFSYEALANSEAETAGEDVELALVYYLATSKQICVPVRSGD